jgi:hypothetical protein
MKATEKSSAKASKELDKKSGIKGGKASRIGVGKANKKGCREGVAKPGTKFEESPQK